MSNTELHEMLIVIAKTPEMFYRDTPILLKSLDDINAIDDSLKKLASLPLTQKQDD